MDEKSRLNNARQEKNRGTHVKTSGESLCQVEVEQKDRKEETKKGKKKGRVHEEEKK